MIKDKEKIRKFDDKAEAFFIKNELLLAEYYANKAYNIAVKIYEPDSLIIANLLHNNAAFLRLRKAFKIAINYFKKSVSIKSNIPKPNDLAASINALGYMYRNIGDYQKAINSFSYAIDVALKNNEIGLATFYWDLARTQKITNNIKDAFPIYQKSISISQKMISEAKPESYKFYEQLIYNCYNDLSEIELNKFELQQSKNYHKQALKVLENSESNINSFFEGYKRFEIPAKIFIKEEKFNKAIEQLQKAKDAIVEEYKGFEVGKDLANIIHQIGECYIELKQYDKALITYQKALIKLLLFCSFLRNIKIQRF